MIRFNACGPDGLLDGWAPGPRSRLNDAQRQALVDVVENRPDRGNSRGVRWRPIDLASGFTTNLRSHAVVLMDQVGWHATGKLEVTGNITIIALSAKCPELNPVENICGFMRDEWLSNCVLTSYNNIIDHCCEAWNKMVDQRWHIMTIGHRKWARGSCSPGWYNAFQSRNGLG